MTIEENVITASEGKVLRRITDKYIAGNQLSLGYTHYMYGTRLPIPILELPEHYEEIDEVPVEEIEEAIVIPQVISRRQAKLALYTEGKLEIVEGAIAGMDIPTQIEWRDATTFEYNNPLLNSMCGLLELDKDSLFILASTF